MHKALTDKQFRRFVEACEVKLLKSGEKDYSEFGAFVFEGEAKSENKTFPAQGSIIPREKSFQTTKESIVFKLSQNITVKEEDNQPRVSKYRE